MKAAVLAALTVCVAALAVTSSATASKPHRLAPSDRKAINATLDIFVNHAVKRKDVAASYGVVTAELRGGMSRKEWSRGSIPVYPYPASGARFHHWTIQYYNSEELAIELLLSPRRGSDLGQFVFHVYLKPAHGGWLVDSFMPAATFAPIGGPAKVQAAADFMASPGESSTPTGPGQVRSVYALVPFAVLGLILLALAAWGLAASFRYRPRRESLPPLPLSIRPDGAQPRPRHRP
jgi:hypothetical protein